MRTSAHCALALALSSIALIGARTIQPLNVKLGLWKTTTTSEQSGMPPIPPEVLARLTPEQRAKIEERAKAAGSAPKTAAYQHCVTREDLNRMIFGDMGASCRPTIVTSTSTLQEYHIECAEKGIKSRGTVRMEALNPGNIRGSVQLAIGDGAHAMHSNTTIASKWMAPACTAADNRAISE